MRWRHLSALALGLGASTIGASAPATDPHDPAAIEFFEKRVRPILVDHCYNCHSANTNSRGGLRVDDRNGLLVGGNAGPAVVPGKPEESLLIAAVRHEGPEMPPKNKLTDEQIADLAKWVADGAAWPSVAVPAHVDRPNEKYDRLRAEHWAWQPISNPRVPVVANTSWPRGDLDRFVLAKLEERGLRPVGDASRVALIRRLTFDLTGLPPTPEDLDRFVADASPSALETLVDRLLASPQFGERWGRHWLDVARYAESTGPSRNIPYPHAWRYRDYVVDAFNADKPFDQFVREQVAGDLLPATDEAQREKQTIATGFLALGVKDVNQRFKVRFIMDNVDEQIDAVSRSVLGLTASCARCHDHKFDPIPQKDYYALAGIFRSTDLCAGVRNKMGGGGLDYYDTQMLLVMGGGAAGNSSKADEIAKVQEELAKAKAKAEFEALRDSPEGTQLGPDGRPKRAAARQRMNKVQLKLAELTDPAAQGATVVLGVRDAKQPADTELRIRGEAEKLGPVVSRGFLGVVSFPDQPKINPSQSGRLELAQWLSDVRNPLTPRVITNRVWQHLFGEGLVRSVDNFGVTGDTPSHPELLDHLAQGFVADGWSIKGLVRRLVLSRAYGLSSEATEEHLSADPENRLVWRHSPRRLDAEEIRDATLAAAGTLDPGRPEASPARELKVIELRNNGPEARRIHEHAAASRHRSVYLPLLRDLTPVSLRVFDFAEQNMVTGSRDTTTVPPQALYLMNDPFVRRESLAFAERLLTRTDLDDSGRIRLAYRIALGREATDTDVARVSRFLAEYASDYEANSTPEPVQLAAVESEPAKPEAPRTPVLDPDQVVSEEAPPADPMIRASNPQAAALAAFCQALVGSAEFRYLP